MIRLLEREAEVVHGEDVFEELGLLEVADAAGLPRRIELVGQRVGARVEVVVVRDSLMRTPQRTMEGWFQSRRIMRPTLSIAICCQASSPMCCQPGISSRTSRPISSQRSRKCGDCG